MGRKANEQSLELKYNGCLDGAKTIYLHYGIGENWETIGEAKMRKLKNCYKTEITIPTDAEFSFCFRDTDGNWDNNYGHDYTYTPEISYASVEISPYTPKTK